MDSSYTYSYPSCLRRFYIFRTLPLIQPTYLSINAQTSPNITWPSQGESAVGVVGTSILDTHGDQTPKPTASTAKLITALMVLKAKPSRP